MNERGIEVKVGILVTVCLALLVVFIVLLGDFSSAGGGDLFMDVPTSADLKPGAVVKLAGVPAGRVREVTYWGGRIDEASGRKVAVRVRMTIEPEKLASIGRDARFYITTQGVLGEKYVEIDPGAFEAERVAAGDVLLGQPPLRIEIMAQNAGELLSSLTRLIRNNEQQLGEIIANANAVMLSARKAIERVQGVVERSEPKIDQVVQNLIALEEQAAALLASARNAVGDGAALKRTIANVESVTGDAVGEVKPVVRDLRAALARVEEIAASGKDLIAVARKGVESVVERVDALVADAQGILRDLKSGKGTIGALLADKELFDDVREMMKDLKRHPWKFLWKE